MYNCLIIEDDFASALDIRVKIENIGYHVEDIVLDLNEKTKLNTKNVDVILSDVKLGNETYAFDLLAEQGKLPPVIFFSSHGDIELYARSKKVNPYVYLMKPVDQVSLKSSIDGALSNKRKGARQEIRANKDQVFVKSRRKLIPIEPKNIVYVHTEGNYCYIITTVKKVVIRASLGAVLDIINYDRIIQTHRAYLINIDYVQNIDIGGDLIQLSKIKSVIPIGRKYKKEILEAIR